MFFTENSPALEYLQTKGLLAPVDASTLAATPSRYNSPHGDWVGVSARVSVLVYNPSLISTSQLPTAVLQLADPRYKGDLALAPSETDFQPIVTSVARTYGKSAALNWLEGIKANAGSHIYPGQRDDRQRGEPGRGRIRRGEPVLLVQDESRDRHVQHALGHRVLRTTRPGYVLDVSSAAILRSSKNQSAAQRFVAFLVSSQGQTIISHSTSFEYPVASGVTTSQPETPFSQLEPNGITVSELGDGSAAIALLDQAGLL